MLHVRRTPRTWNPSSFGVAYSAIAVLHRQAFDFDHHDASCGVLFTSTRSHNDFVPSDPPVPANDALDASPTSCYFAAAVMIINKTFSTEAAARAVPPGMCLDRTSRF